ncbi:Gp15 family bacteriophage protein [Pseudomonas sp.]|uniref:Gp15 family bacteriophage protein n=1 Tax=Pseudomonas sp. TaxID=306 RepID=UPI002617363C|nr:Gp15 family bacteriophage protein [Pseudomonas sp.]
MDFIGKVKPRKIKFQGEIYNIHDDYRNILNTIKLLEQEEDEFERAIIIVQTIFGSNAPIDQKLVVKASEIMWNGKDYEEVDEKEKVHQDLIQDYPVYKMDIMREFNKEIEKMEYLSWSDFLDLVSSLSKDSNMANYVKIRSTPLKDISKDKRKEFKKFQDKIAIKQNEEVEYKETIFDKHMREQKEKYNKERKGV